MTGVTTTNDQRPGFISGRDCQHVSGIPHPVYPTPTCAHQIIRVLFFVFLIKIDLELTKKGEKKNHLYFSWKTDLSIMKIMPNDQGFPLSLANKELSYKFVVWLINCVAFMISIIAVWFSAWYLLPQLNICNCSMDLDRPGHVCGSSYLELDQG